MWSLLLTKKLPLIVGIVLLLALGGMYLLHRYESAEIKEQAATIIKQEIEIVSLKADIKTKEEKIENLQLTMDTANKNMEDFQARNTKLIGIINSLGKPVVIQSTGKNELNAINKADSDKFIKWMNEEIWK